MLIILKNAAEYLLMPGKIFPGKWEWSLILAFSNSLLTNLVNPFLSFLTDMIEIDLCGW